MLDLTQKPYGLNEIQIQAVKKQVAALDTEAKIGQLFFPIGQDEKQVDIPAFIQKYQPGGIMYRPDTSSKIRRELAACQAASTLPLFTAANLESGGNGIITDGTYFGTPLEMAATDDPHSAYELGAVAGEEAHAVGTNMAFAPIVDIDQNFRNPIMNTRTFGSDQQRVLRMSDAQRQGLEKHHVIPVIKHFPGDGVDERDQHLLASVNSLSADDWMASYGQIYRHMIEGGISTVMIAHILQPAWERQLDPGIADQDLRPASSSANLINGLLRTVLKFNGLAITDATPMLGYNAVMPREQLLPATINAGIDMILFNKNIDEDYAIIRTAVANGTISQERLDEAVTRIVGTKVAQGLMTVDGQPLLSMPDADVLVRNQAAHAAQAEAVASKAVTLVKDRDHLLPLTPEKYPRIRLYVLGDSDDGGFKEGGQVTGAFQQQLEAAGFAVTLFDPKHLDFHEIFEEGVADLKKKFDLALYIANVETASNQTTTRLDWIHLMAANAPWFMKDIPTVFVSTANPYHLFDIPMVSTFVNAYTGNQATIAAVMRKLLGQEKFLGKSPVDPFCGDLTARL